jgi:hypothetical protein
LIFTAQGARLGRAAVAGGDLGKQLRIMIASDVGSQDPKDLARDGARDLSGMSGEPAALKRDAVHWLTDPEYAVLRHRLEAAHAAVEAALAESKRRVRLNEARER